MRRHIFAGLLFSFLPIGTPWFQLLAQENGSETNQEEVAVPVVTEPELRGVMILRVSERYLEELFARDINKHSSVARLVLGTRATGTAHTQGRADVDTKPDHNDAAFYVRITGSTHSRTVGRNGPAIIHSRSCTSWSAQKVVRFDGEEFVTSPAIIQSQTNITPLGAGSVLPGLRGRIVSRIATRRAVEYNSTAERISGRDTDQQVLSDVDRVVGQQIAKLNERIESRPLMAMLLPRLKDAGVEFSTHSNCINISFGGSSSPEAKLCPVEGLEPSDTELWLQAGMIVSPGAKIPELIDDVGEWLSEQVPDVVDLPGIDLTALNSLPLNVKVVDDWLVFRSQDLPAPTVQVTGKPVISD